MKLKAPDSSDTVVADMAPRQFGKVFAAHRKKAGLTQEQLVEAAGMPRGATISDIENDRYLPNIPDLQKLVRAMGTTLSDLFADYEGLRRKPAPDGASATPAAVTAAVTAPAQTALAPGKEVIDVPSPVHRALFATLAALPAALIADFLTAAADRVARLTTGSARESATEGDVGRRQNSG